MKVEFCFNDRTSIVLKPETERERTMIRLAFIENSIKNTSIEYSLDPGMQLTLTICELHS
jgi:hypothetical protein